MHEDKGRHEHEERHAGVDPEQIRTLIPYLIKHNLDHVEDLKKWQKQAIESGFSSIEAEFRKIIKLSEKIDRHFKSALKKINKR